MKQTVRLLHIVGDSNFGGGSLIILRLAEMARAQGWEVDVLSTDSELLGLLSSRGIGGLPLDVIRRPIRPIFDAFGLIKLWLHLRKHPYTIVHTHTSKGGFVGRLAARLAGIPIIVHTVHGFSFHEASSPVALRVYSTLERMAATWCDKLVTVSNYHREWALRLNIGSLDSVIAIPNGVSEARVAPKASRQETRASWGLQDDEKAILAMGRLAPQKGFEYLLRAVPSIVQSYKGPLKVIIAGDGPLRDELESISKSLNIQDYITFLGFTHSIGDVLDAADVVVLPSLWEGLSIALLEAMAAAKPIVTTTIGSNIEVLGDSNSAALVDPANAEKLAESILLLLDAPDIRQRMASDANRLFRARYSETAMLDSYLQCYLSLLKDKFPSADFNATAEESIATVHHP